MPTTADRSRGDWLRPFLEACGDALVVSLEPGVDEAAVIRAARPDVRLAAGVIALIAYQAPLPGETRFPEPGIAVWVPPGGAPLAGEGIGPFAEVLRKGGMRVRIARDLSRESAFGSLAFASTVSALHAVGWSFDALRGSDVLDLARRAAQQGAAITERHTGLRRPFWLGLLRPWPTRLLLRVRPRCTCRSRSATASGSGCRPTRCGSSPRASRRGRRRPRGIATPGRVLKRAAD